MWQMAIGWMSAGQKAVTYAQQYQALEATLRREMGFSTAKVTHCFRGMSARTLKLRCIAEAVRLPACLLASVLLSAAACYKLAIACTEPAQVQEPELMHCRASSRMATGSEANATSRTWMAGPKMLAMPLLDGGAATTATSITSGPATSRLWFQMSCCTLCSLRCQP